MPLVNTIWTRSQKRFKLIFHNHRKSKFYYGIGTGANFVGPGRRSGGISIRFAFGSTPIWKYLNSQYSCNWHALRMTLSVHAPSERKLENQKCGWEEIEILLFIILSYLKPELKSEIVSEKRGSDTYMHARNDFQLTTGGEIYYQDNIDRFSIDQEKREGALFRSPRPSLRLCLASFPPSLDSALWVI